MPAGDPERNFVFSSSRALCAILQETEIVSDKSWWFELFPEQLRQRGPAATSEWLTAAPFEEAQGTGYLADPGANPRASIWAEELGEGTFPLQASAFPATKWRKCCDFRGLWGGWRQALRLWVSQEQWGQRVPSPRPQLMLSMLLSLFYLFDESQERNTLLYGATGRVEESDRTLAGIRARRTSPDPHPVLPIGYFAPWERRPEEGDALQS